MHAVHIYALIAGLLLGKVAAADELRWKLKAGDELDLRFEQESEVVSTIAGKSTSMTIATGMQLAWRVESVQESGTAIIAQRFERLQMTLEMPTAGTISYDSAAEEKPTGDAKTIADSVQPLLASEAKVTMTSRGEILSVELDEAAQEALAALAGAEAVKKLLSKDGLTQVLRQTLIVLPDGEIKPGETWTRVTALPGPIGMLKQSTTFTLLEPAADAAIVARIESQATLELAPTPATSKIELKEQEQSGTILFDTEAGRLRTAEIKQKLVTGSKLKDTAIEVTLRSTLRMSVDAK